MTKYTNKTLGFELEFPAGWRGKGILSMLLSSFGHDVNPEFVGPNGAEIEFAIGAISQKTSLEKQQKNMTVIARMYEYDVMSIDAIDVSGEKHATMLYDILYPELDQLLVTRFKKYSLIFGETKYLATTKIATLPRGISLTRPQQLDLDEFNRQQMNFGEYARSLQKIHIYEQDSDKIIQTFRLVK